MSGENQPQEEEGDTEAPCSACNPSTTPPLLAAPEPCPSLYTLPSDSCDGGCGGGDDSGDTSVAGTLWAEGGTCNCAFGSKHTITPVARMGGGGDWIIPDNAPELLPSSLYQVFRPSAGTGAEGDGCQLPSPTDTLVPAGPSNSVANAGYSSCNSSYVASKLQFNALTLFPSHQRTSVGLSTTVRPGGLSSISLQEARQQMRDDVLAGSYLSNSGPLLDSSVSDHAIFDGTYSVAPVLQGGPTLSLQKTAGCTLDALKQGVGALWKEKESEAGAGSGDGSGEDDIPCEACDGLKQPPATANPPPKQYKFAPPPAGDPQACTDCPDTVSGQFQWLLPLLQGPEIDAYRKSQAQQQQLQACASS